MNKTLLICCLAIIGICNAQSQKDVLKTKHFSQALNTGSNHTLLILDSAWPLLPEIGDEIAFYDASNKLVASVNYQDGHNGIALFGDDETTEKKDGLSLGEVFNLVLWDQSEDRHISYKMTDFEVGGSSYIQDGLTVVASLSENTLEDLEMELFQNVPNPVIDQTTIQFYIPENGDYELNIVDLLGNQIENISVSQANAGMYSHTIGTSKLNAGMYLYTLHSNNKSLTKQLSVVK